MLLVSCCMSTEAIILASKRVQRPVVTGPSPPRSVGLCSAQNTVFTVFPYRASDTILLGKRKV